MSSPGEEVISSPSAYTHRAEFDHMQVEAGWIEWAQDVTGQYVTTRDEARAAIEAVASGALRLIRDELPRVRSEAFETATSHIPGCSECSYSHGDRQPPIYCKPCSEAVGDWVEWTPEHVSTPPATSCPHCKGMGQVYDGPRIVWKPCPMCKPLPSESGSTPGADSGGASV